MGHAAQRGEGRQGLGALPGRRGSWGGGALADPLWSLVRRAQNPFSREKRRCGLKGYEGAGGCWPLGWPGAGGVLRHGEPGQLGLLEGDWELRLSRD